MLEKLIGSGGKKTNREIAEELFLTPKSVENYITRIGKQLELPGKGNVKEWASGQYKKRD